MICYLIRHGADDETIRGGWSQHSLTDEGVRQIAELADLLISKLNVTRIYTSDLHRALQTAQILGDRFSCPVIPLSQFREVNNGDLAGMKNDIARKQYPGLFWNQLGWEQCYPGGESPKQFYDRINNAWTVFSEMIAEKDENVMLVTHGGVIHVIRAILENRLYSNVQNNAKVAHAEVIPVVYEKDGWTEL